MKLKFYISLFISLLSLSVYAQEPTLTAKVSKNKLGLNQRLRIEFSINSIDGKDFSPPKFRKFKIIGKPTNSARATNINGKFSYFSSHNYIIQPKKKGKLTIGSARIKINGKILKTKSLKIIVTDPVIPSKATIK